MVDTIPLSWEVCLRMVGPQPVAFAVVTPCKTDYGNTTRDPNAEESARIKAWIRRFVARHDATPVGAFEVGRVGMVCFRRIWQ
jgi:hypothetical protein